MIVVAIAGARNSGKTTFANALKKTLDKANLFFLLGRRTVIYNFADAVKDIACTALQISREELEELKTDGVIKTPFNDVTGRQFLQKFATEGMQSVFGKTVWADCLIERIKQDNPDIAIIADARFYHEISALENEFGLEDVFVVKITGGTKDKHVSETELALEKDKFFDHVIENANHDADLELEALRAFMKIFDR